MEITKDQLNKIEKFVESKLDSLNWYHTQAMRPIAKKLAGLEKADKDIVDVAVLFHDIVKGSKDHGEKGAEIARKYLEKENFEQRFVEEVVYCVIAHQLPWKNQSNLVNTPEAKVLFDSDMIQQVGRFGIIKESINYQDLIRKNHRDGLKKVRDILFEEYNNIFTNNGRKMAEEGYKFVKDFFKDLL